jgi:signal peptide peptidase SppA
MNSKTLRKCRQRLAVHRRQPVTTEANRDTMNTAAIPNFITQFSAPWLMREDRVQALLGRIQSMPAKPENPKAESEAVDPAMAPKGYGVRHGVARIDVCGVLTKYPMPESWMDEWCGFCPAMPILETLQRALDDWMVRSIVFVIDSPGGMVAGTNLLAEAIAEADKKKPCHAVVSDLAASGGYYIASQCRSIACNAMGKVGCIGVYCVLTDVSKFYEELGVKFSVVSSGGVKGLGADGVVSQELIDDQKRGVMGMYEKFIADVAMGRGISIDESRKLGDGRCWIAPEALKLGLIDVVASVEASMQAITKETHSMTSEQVRAFAAEHPDDEAVKAIRNQGTKAGHAEGVTAERARVTSIIDAAAKHPSLAFEAIKSGQEADAVGLAVKALDEQAAKAKADADAKDAEIARLQAEAKQAKEREAFIAGGGKPIGTAGAPESQPEASTIADPTERAKAEWKANADDLQDRYASEDVYVKARVRQLRQA